MSRAQQKRDQARLDALCAHLDATQGPKCAADLSRSYGVDESKIADILRKRGRYLP